MDRQAENCGESKLIAADFDLTFTPKITRGTSDRNLITIKIHQLKVVKCSRCGYINVNQAVGTIGVIHDRCKVQGNPSKESKDDIINVKESKTPLNLLMVQSMMNLEITCMKFLKLWQLHLTTNFKMLLLLVELMKTAKL